MNRTTNTALTALALLALAGLAPARAEGQPAVAQAAPSQPAQAAPADPAAPGQPAKPATDAVAACACHDALNPAGATKVVNLRGWAKDGPHLAQGCVACHPGADAVPHAKGFSAAVDCASCHAKEAANWKETVHGRLEGKDARIKGCQTCHAEHVFLPNGNRLNRYMNTGLLKSCAACHAPMPMSPTASTLELKPAPAGHPYPSSYHGLVVDIDHRSFANCASCHDAHQIFPSSDPRSTLHASKLVESCGPCHTDVQPGQIHGKFRQRRGGLNNYFDVWYLWATGTVLLTLLGVAGSLGAASVMRRRSQDSHSKKETD